MKTKYQKTVDKIIEANPSILELKFGCRIKKDWGMNNVGEYIVTWKFIDTVEVVSFDGQHLPSVPTFKIGTFKILGRDITLEDVLLTIDRQHNFEKGYVLSWFSSLMTSYNYWQFNKPFREQSQETKDFIGDLILTK